MLVRLVTSDGRSVLAEGEAFELPPFSPPPEVICWGTRIVVCGEEREACIEYREGIGYVVVEGATAHRVRVEASKG